MRYARQLLRAAQDVSIPSGAAMPAPKYWEPASKAPSPMIHLVIGTGVGLVFAGYYKVRCWQNLTTFRRNRMDLWHTCCKVYQLTRQSDADVVLGLEEGGKPVLLRLQQGHGRGGAWSIRVGRVYRPTVNER